MLQFQEIKKGNYFIVGSDGDMKTCTVVDKNRYNNQVCLFNGVQDFWYDIKELKSIPLNEKTIMQMKFSKQVNPDGTIKYCKGAFRALIPKEGDFSRMEIWYRDEHRIISKPLCLHEMQNHFQSMTKVLLNENAY